MSSWIRKLHAYCGALFAPTVLFFAFTGVLQVYNLHEAQPDTGYRPPEIVRMMSDLHKDQVIRPPRVDQPGDHAKGHGHHHDQDGPPAAPRLRQLLLKGFVTAVAVGLILSTLSGLYMALKNRRDRRLALALLAAGIVIPLGLILV